MVEPLRGLIGCGQCPRGAWLPLALFEALFLFDLFHVVPGDLPALSLRSDHASGLENPNSGDLGLDRSGRSDGLLPSRTMESLR